MQSCIFTAPVAKHWMWILHYSSSARSSA